MKTMEEIKTRINDLSNFLKGELKEYEINYYKGQILALEWMLNE